MILLETTFLSYKGSGICTVIENLINAFNEQKIEYKTISYFDSFSIKKQYSWFSYFNFCLQKRIKQLKKDDIFLCPANLGGFYYYTKKKCRSIFIIHDLFEFSTENKFKNKINYIRLKNVLKNVNTIITVSELSKKNILKKLPYVKDNVVVLYPFFIKNLKKRNLNKIELKNYFTSWDDTFKNFILVNGSGQKRKNTEFIIQYANKIYKDFNLKIVMFGRDFNNNGYAELNAAIHNNRCEDKILHLGSVSEEQLNALYTETKCFIFPSIDEGFGLPPLEALSCNGKVLCSNIPIFKEVLYPCADLFDFNYESFFTMLNKILNTDETQYYALRKLILEKFTYENFINKIKEIIQ